MICTIDMLVLSTNEPAWNLGPEFVIRVYMSNAMVLRIRPSVYRSCPICVGVSPGSTWNGTDLLDDETGVLTLKFHQSMPRDVPNPRIARPSRTTSSRFIRPHPSRER